jgi:hypothetical protein
MTLWQPFNRISNDEAYAMSTYTGTIEIEATDIPTMRAMSNSEYWSFVKGGALFWIDHHDVVRSTPAEYPLATTKAQLDMMIAALKEFRDRMPD